MPGAATPQLEEAVSDASSQQKRSLRARQLVSYKNNTDYIDFDVSDDEEEPEQPASKRARLDTAQQDSDATLDAETAWALGFTPATLTAEEEDLLPGDADEGVYCRVRNHVLTTWRADVSRWLSEADAAAGVWQKHRAYVTTAWHFLNDHGYINFGVAASIHAKMLAAPASEGAVIIIGAGMAGLAAARQLRASGHKVVILEGNGRAGGRVYTKRLEGGGLAAVADLGGSILTGIDGNPLAVLARQLRIPLHHINSECVPLYCADGREANRRLDQQVEQMYNKLLDESDRFREDMGDITDNVSLETALETAWDELESKTGQPEERQLLDWHMANLEFANAQLLRRLSMRSWDQDDPHEVPGQHAFLPGCNIRLVEALAQDLPIFFDHVVTGIDYSEAGVAVHTAKQTFTAEAALVTVPLGVLKAGSIRFQPPLPPRKQDAVARMGFGILNKVVLLFPRQFWPKDADMFGRISETTAERGDFFLFYSYADLAGGPLLAALVSGDAGAEFEKQSPEAIVQRVLGVLERIFKPKGIQVPQPVQAVCTRWGSDPMARGSYSSLCVGSAGGEDYDAVADCLGGRLFFAGEATTKKYPATMHGAFFTGLREAASIKATLAKRAAEAARRRHRVEAPSTPTPSEAKPHTDQQEARQRANLERAAQLEALLHAAFFDAAHPPDLEFGCFAAVLGPRGSGFEGEALLRIDTGDARGGSRRHLPMFVQLTERQATMLRDVRGGDDARIDAMTGPLGVKLVGRSPLPARAADFLRAVLSARGTPLPQPLPSAPGSVVAAAEPAVMAPAPMAAAAAPRNAVPAAGHPAAGAPAASGAPRPPPIRVKLQVPPAARPGPVAQPGHQQQQAVAAAPPGSSAAPQLRTAASAAHLASHQQIRSPAAVQPQGASVGSPVPAAEGGQTSGLPASAPSVSGATAAVSRPAAGSDWPAAGSTQSPKQPAALHPDAILAWAQQLHVSRQHAPRASSAAAGAPVAASGAASCAAARTAGSQQPAAPAAAAAAQPQPPPRAQQPPPLQHQPKPAVPGTWIPLHPSPASPPPQPRTSLDVP